MTTSKGSSTRSRSGSSTRRKPAKKKQSAASRAEQERREVFGLVFLSLGLILGLFFYTGTTGGLGAFITDYSGRCIGLLRFVLPLLSLLYGWHTLRTKKKPKKKTPLPTTELIARGSLFVGVVSLVDMIGGRPGWDSEPEALSKAAGWLGVNIGGTLSSNLGDWGQVVITITLFAVAAVFLTSVSLGPAVDSLAERVEPMRGHMNDRLSQLGWFASAGEAGSPRRRVKFKPVFDEDAGDGEHDEDYIDLRSPDALEEIDSRRESEVQELEEPEQTMLPWGKKTEPVIEVPETVVAQSMPVESLQPADGTWYLPSIDVLDRTESQEVDRASVEATGRQLEHALAEHGVETRLIGVVVGPTVSRFELELGPGVKVQKVTSLHKDIAYAMATPDVRILAPIPGKQAIGVEVPNVRRQIITVGDLLVSEEAVAATHALEVVLGRDITGRTVVANLAEMPHLLVAGQTGSGKSSCINSMLTSILMRSTPDQVRLILIDPKRVELTQYEQLPHLLTEVVTDPKKAANALSWAVTEMERRYDLLSDFGARDLNGYNTAVEEGRVDAKVDAYGDETEASKLSYILIVLDELADLMMVAARDVEESICRIAQKARAVGIHLVIATQRPSTNVITGLIKANVPARLAFAVSSLTDSRVILDQPGAERLVGRGDGLLNNGRTSSPTRFQGAWVTEEEVSSIVAHWADQAPDQVYDSRVLGEEAAGGAVDGIPGGTTGDDSDDELMMAAIELIVRSQLGSTSMLQRKLRVGFARAGRLMDLLEERGIVGPSVGSKAREVMMTAEDLDAGRWPAAAAVAAPIASPALPSKRAQQPRRTVEAKKSNATQPVIEKRDRRRTIAEIPNPEPVQVRPMSEPLQSEVADADDEFAADGIEQSLEHEIEQVASEPDNDLEDDFDLEPDPELGLDRRAHKPRLRVIQGDVSDEEESLGDEDNLFDDIFDDGSDEDEDDPTFSPPPGYGK